MVRVGENMAGAFEEDVEKTVTIDEYLEDVEAQELVNFCRVYLFIYFACFVVSSLGFRMIVLEVSIFISF